MIITHSIPTTNILMDRNRVRLSNNKNMNKFLLEAASCQYSMCITNQGRLISLRLIMYKLYIVRIFDPPLSVCSSSTYKFFVLTHTSKLKLEKSIVFHSPNQIWLRCYSATVSAIRSISPIHNKGALLFGCACCCV